MHVSSVGLIKGNLRFLGLEIRLLPGSANLQKQLYQKKAVRRGELEVSEAAAVRQSLI